MSVSLALSGRFGGRPGHRGRALDAGPRAQLLEQPLIDLRAGAAADSAGPGSVIENVTRRDRSNPASTLVRL